YGLLVSLRRDAESAALFAYTTLFRSEAGGGFDGSGGLEAVQGVAGDRVGGEYAGVHRRVGPAGVDDPELIVAAGVGSGQPRDGQDRKSTRLNSSHVKISYAVFCLKKK